VEWKKDGRSVNTSIKSSACRLPTKGIAGNGCVLLNWQTEQRLLEAISSQIQRLKPDNIPKPPYTTAILHSSAPKPSVKSAKSKSKVLASATPKVQGSCCLPIPPVPHPPLVSRVSPYSPALVTGVLIDTVKAGMNANEGAGVGAAGPGGGGVGKGKRKVVRVRG
jgi:signal recognition particle subunit SRP19